MIKPDTSELSTLSLAIIGLIAQKPCSGYDIRKVFATTPMGSFSSSPGAIYPALKRIEQNGWIRGKTSDQKSLRGKSIFSLTNEGRKLLQRRLLLPITRDDVIWRMDDLILRFAFMEEIVGRKSTLRFLKEYRQETGTYAASLADTLEEMRTLLSTSARLALEHGIESYRMNARWAARSITEFKSPETERSPRLNHKSL